MLMWTPQGNLLHRTMYESSSGTVWTLYIGPSAMIDTVECSINIDIHLYLNFYITLWVESVVKSSFQVPREVVMILCR